MLDFPKFLHLGKTFLNQSDCRICQTSYKQPILNMYLDIIEGLDILGTNESIKCFAWSWSTQECPQLDQSNSNILETPVTQKKF